MAYHLAEGESMREALRRSGREQLDEAIVQLRDRFTTDQATAVHEARKALKQERALLRLSRGSLGRRQRRAENAAARAAGRRLSGARDAEVMVQALDGLRERYAGQFPSHTIDVIRERIESDRQLAHMDIGASGLASEVVDDLKAARTRVESWRLKQPGWRAIDEGLRRTYRDGQKAMERVQRAPTLENLHEWRKRGKDLWYELKLLEPIARNIMHGLVKEAHHLADLLGDDHDLGVLRDTVGKLAPQLPVDSDPVLAALDHRRGELQAQALVVGQRIYAERPKAFMRRMRRYWKTRRAESALTGAPAHRPAELAEATRGYASPSLTH
jgi:CHAD domain-containing protein